MAKLKFGADLFCKLLCEFTGTAMLLFLGSMVNAYTSGVSNYIGWGLVYTTVTHIFAFLSGAHVNPCVSGCAAIVGYMDWKLMLMYMLMHFLGGFFGYGLYSAVVTKYTSLFSYYYLIGRASTGKMILVEFLLTTIWLLTYCATWDKGSGYNYDSLSVRLGMVFTGLSCCGKNFGSANLNFVRAFVPNVCHEYFDDLWIYLIAHLLATFAAPLLWRFVLSGKARDSDAWELNEK